MNGWYQFKIALSQSGNLHTDSLHVMLGLVGVLVFAWLLGTSIARWTPWLVVLGLELLNEAYDLWIERWPDLGQQCGEGLKDLVLTMALPTLLLLLARHRPWLFAR